MHSSGDRFYLSRGRRRCWNGQHSPSHFDYRISLVSCLHQRLGLIVEKIEIKLLKETYQPTVGMDPARFDPLKGS